MYKNRVDHIHASLYPDNSNYAFVQSPNNNARTLLDSLLVVNVEYIGQKGVNEEAQKYAFFMKSYVYIEHIPFDHCTPTFTWMRRYVYLHLDLSESI